MQKRHPAHSRSRQAEQDHRRGATVSTTHHAPRVIDTPQATHIRYRFAAEPVDYEATAWATQVNLPIACRGGGNRGHFRPAPVLRQGQVPTHPGQPCLDAVPVQLKVGLRTDTSFEVLPTMISCPVPGII